MGTLNLLSAVEAARGIAAGRFTSEMLVHDCIGRIAAREGEVQAWEHLNPDAALEQARAADAYTGPRGLLHGVPVGVKDVIDVLGMPTTCGSRIYAGHLPIRDAACVARIRAAGGLVLGKAVTAELLLMCAGKTRNPHNLNHTPGGSSSGSAAAVADYMVPLALGTQTAGSVIRPAAYCGVVGYISFGMIDRGGVKLISGTLDTVGTIARTVPDAALLAAAITGRHDLLANESQSFRPRVGLCRTYEWGRAEPETVAALEGAAGRLSAAGAEVHDVTLPPMYAHLTQAQTDIMLFEMAWLLGYERLCHWSRLSHRLQGMLETGLGIAIGVYQAAKRLADDCRRMIPQVFADYDVLLAPSAPGAAPEGLSTTGDPVFNRMWTLLRTPCVTIPVAAEANGLPVGLQVIGALDSDARTLTAAHWLHQTLSPPS